MPSTTLDPQRVRRLRIRILVDIYLVYLGIQALLVAVSLLNPLGAPRSATDGLMVIGIAAGVALVLLLPADRIGRTPRRYLSDQAASAPHVASAGAEVQSAVLEQPLYQAAFAFVPWIVGAVGTFVVVDLSGGGFALGSLAIVAYIFSGLGAAAIVRTRVEDLWRPFLPYFFGEGDDPTTLRVSRRFTLPMRFLRTYLWATVYPIVVLATAVFAATLDPRSTVFYVRVMTLTVGAIGVGFGAIGMLALAGNVLASVDKLDKAAQRVESGTLDTRVQIDRADEIGRLGRAFNEMIAGLRTRDRIADLFQRQVGDKVAEFSLEEGHLLGGSQRRVTAMFIDLVSFTTIAEARPAAEVVDLLNTVFGVVVKSVSRHDGLVNKFEGDAALAIFGAPNELADHEHAAVLAAREIARELRDLGIDFGIGIASGNVVAGNVGAHSRYEYTVIGDAVNVASRLEELTRETDARVLVAASAAEPAAGTDASLAGDLHPLGDHLLRGRASPTSIFALDVAAT